MLLREELAAGRLRHFCMEGHRPCQLTEQLGSARVVTSPMGQVSIVSSGRTDTLRAALWALTEQLQNPPVVPRIY